MLPKITTHSPLLWATLLFAAPGLSNAQTVTAFNPTLDSFLTSGSVQPDGKGVFGGQFTTVNGETRNRFVRLNTEELWTPV